VLRILLTRRWVILTLVFATLIPVMVELGFWQFHRYQQTNRSNKLINANVSAPVVPLASLSHPGATVPGDLIYRRVTATGRYDTAHQFVVRNRTDTSGDTIGFYLVTPLVEAGGDVVLVNRGWVAPNSDNGAAFPSVPAAPRGSVTVVGRLRPDETTASTGIRDVGGLPPHQYMLINSGEQTKALSEPVVAGYLDLMTTSPSIPAADTAQQVPGPNADNDSNSDDDAVVGKGVHLPYAIQWWLFALMVPIGWWKLFRRDVRDQRLGVGRAAGGPDAAPVKKLTVEEYLAERRAAAAAEAARAEAEAAEPAEPDADTTAGSAPVAVGKE
jgi:cytochrome oxidase assembly protein ShyY1